MEEDGADGTFGQGDDVDDEVDEDSLLDSDVQGVVNLSSTTSLSSSICFFCGFDRPRYECDHRPHVVCSCR